MEYSPVPNESVWLEGMRIGGPAVAVILALAATVWFVGVKFVMPMLQLSRANTADQVEIAKQHATSAVALKDATASVNEAAKTTRELLRIAQHMTGTDDDALNDRPTADKND